MVLDGVRLSLPMLLWLFIKNKSTVLWCEKRISGLLTCADVLEKFQEKKWWVPFIYEVVLKIIVLYISLLKGKDG